MPKAYLDERDARSVHAVERACDVLDVVCSSAHPLGAKEISELSKLSISTVFRLLTALSKKQMVDQDPTTKRYTMGRKMTDYGLGYLRHLELPTVCAPYLRQLRDEIGETATVSAVDGLDRVYLFQVESPQEIRQTVDLGQRIPLHLGGSGKAILAFMPASDLNRYLEQARLSPGLSGPIDPEHLRAELAEIRRAGYAHSFGERLPGAASVAAPIRNFRGEVIGCISLGGPAVRFTRERVAQLGPVVKEAADEISRELGAAAG